MNNDNTLALLQFWLMTKPALITVTGPFILFSLGLLLVPKLRQGSGKLLALALLSVPVVHLTSFWGAGGLHLAPIVMLVMVYLTVTKKLDVSRQWFGVMVAQWLGTLVPDVIGAWTQFGDGVGSLQTWYFGVGGYGFDDGLVVGPLVGTAALWLVQRVLDRNTGSVVGVDLLAGAGANVGGR